MVPPERDTPGISAMDWPKPKRNASREDLVAEEEEHQDLFETEMDNLEKFGDNYLALQSIERSKTAAAGAAKQE